jgi:WD40 repeat protein
VPLAVIGGHSKAVSYVRWMGGSGLVSASTDNALKVWDVARGVAADSARHHAWAPTATLTGGLLPSLDGRSSQK